MMKNRVNLERCRPLGPSIGTIIPTLVTGLWLAWTTQPCAASQASIQLAQSATDLLQLGKEAAGLGEQTPEGQSSTGITKGVPFLVRFRDTVGGLRPGAAVHVRGMQMGAVREVRITFDPATVSFDIPVVIELDPTPFKKGEATEADAKQVQDAVAAMVRKGLRAELGAANLIPGGLAVMLELQPEATPAELRQGAGGLLEIPTAGKPLEPLTAKLERVAARVSALPLEQTMAEVNGLIAAARRIIEDPALKRLLANLAETSEALTPAARRLDPTLRAAADAATRASAALTATRVLLERSEGLPQELDRTLGENKRSPPQGAGYYPSSKLRRRKRRGMHPKGFTDAARSLRLLAEMLERQPQALLRGKSS